MEAKVLIVVPGKTGLSLLVHHHCEPDSHSQKRLDEISDKKRETKKIVIVPFFFFMESGQRSFRRLKPHVGVRRGKVIWVANSMADLC